MQTYFILSFTIPNKILKAIIKIILILKTQDTFYFKEIQCIGRHLQFITTLTVRKI